MVTITTEQRTDFIGYVLSYYGEGGIYLMLPAPTLDEVGSALDLLLAHYPYGLAAFQGDSHDRELVRDIMRARRGERRPMQWTAEGPDDGLEYAVVVLPMLEASAS